jgi:tRNA-specific 2-thiouridylase
MGQVIGEHEGAHFFTIGQRKGLQVGGRPEPLYVIGIDTNLNIVYVGEGDQHPGLFRKGLTIEAADEHWIREDKRIEMDQKKDLLVRIRYRQPLQKATLHRIENNIHIVFNEKQRGITPGQFAAWYDGEELVGSGVIRS